MNGALLEELSQQTLRGAFVAGLSLVPGYSWHGDRLYFPYWLPPFGCKWPVFTFCHLSIARMLGPGRPPRQPRIE